MIYLLLSAAMLFNSLQGFISKQYNVKTERTNTYIYTAVVATAAMLFFMLQSIGKFEFNAGVLFYSAAFSVSYIFATVGNVQAIGCGPLSVSSLIYQFSLILPTMYGIVFLKESISLWGYMGIFLLFVSLFWVNPQNNNETKPSKGWFIWVSLGFLGNGMCATVQKMQQIAFAGNYKNEFMIVALLLTAIVMYAIGIMKSRCPGEDIKNALKYAPLQGIANGALNELVLILAGLLPAAILFPAVLSGGTIITLTVSIVFFRERLSKKQLAGYLLGIISIIALNIK